MLTITNTRDLGLIYKKGAAQVNAEKIYKVVEPCGYVEGRWKNIPCALWDHKDAVHNAGILSVWCADSNEVPSLVKYLEETFR